MKQIFLDEIWGKDGIRKLISSFSDVDTLDISISYVSDFKNAKKLRKFMDTLCVCKHISWKWRTRLVLISDELNNNAMEYGSKEGDINIFRVQLQQKEGSQNISISVSDTWSWAEAKNSSQMQEIREKLEDTDYSQHHSIRWRWLFLIINQLVDTLIFHDSDIWWLTVQVEKRLS